MPPPPQSTLCRRAGMPNDSVANVTALLTLDKTDCRVVEGTIPSHLMRDIDVGLRTVLALTGFRSHS